ncbi:hypothetical protein ACLK1T_13140 [Escherichia coli]
MISPPIAIACAAVGLVGEGPDLFRYCQNTARSSPVWWA